MNPYRDLLEEAYQSRAPKAWKRLQEEGKAHQLVEDLAEEALEVQRMTMQGLAEKSPLPEEYLARVQRLNQDRDTAREIAREQAIEQIPNEEELEESEDLLL